MHPPISLLADAAMGDPLLHALKAAIHDLAPTMSGAERRALARDIACQAIEAEMLGESAVEAALIEMYGVLSSRIDTA